MAKPKLNQPCPCGSGLKFKRCCFLNQGRPNYISNSCNNNNNNSERRRQDEEENIQSSSSGYRFRVGDRVEAAMGKEGYRPGTVVALNYREPGWLGSCPYQIHLDGVVPHLIYAPFDDDDYVRALPTADAKRRRRRSQTQRVTN